MASQQFTQDLTAMTAIANDAILVVEAEVIQKYREVVLAAILSNLSAQWIADRTLYLETAGGPSIPPTNPGPGTYP